MRGVTIDLARGSDTAIDPRVAPNGTIARAENVRVDKLGRLVTRSGYTSLGTGLQMSATNMVPLDLHDVDGTLVCLGNASATAQGGIRHAYRYMGASNVQGPWRRELMGDDNLPAQLATASFGSWDIPAADNVRILMSEVGATHTGTVGASADVNTSDVAVTADGVYVAMVSQGRLINPFARVSVVETASGRIAFYDDLAAAAESNPRVLAIGQVFYIFSQIGTVLNCRTLNMAAATPALSAATAVAGMTTAPGPYDVSNYAGSTDFLLAFATATGYTVRRYTSAVALVVSNNVVSLANAPVSVAGQLGHNISVVCVRAGTGVEWRSHNPATGAVVLGPTNLDPAALVYVWVSVTAEEAAGGGSVFVRFLSESPARVVNAARVTVSSGAVLALSKRQDNTRPVTKAVVAVSPDNNDSTPFAWQTLGIGVPAPYGLVQCSDAPGVDSRLCATVLDGAAKVTFSADTTFQQSAIVRVSGTTQYYTSLIGKDPRDGTFRAYLVAFELFSGKRRQGVTSAGVLYLAGGNAVQYDKRMVGEVGFDIAPSIRSATAGGGGSLTLLGTYTYQAVYRAVMANGEAIQSAPSAPVTGTLTGGNQSFFLNITCPYASWIFGTAGTQHVSAFLDIYRTEAGGSIPRFEQSIAMLSNTNFGVSINVTSSAADSVVQGGSPLYTQGADGSVSGRLPLGLAGPARLIAESDGKLLLAGLERDTDIRLSIEQRPGEAIGFVNDDLFFVQNPEAITALVAGEDGRRFIFGRSNIRELIGQGPNAAGVGDIAEPVEIDSRVGCVDWRSVVKTELGVMFQGSATASRPSLYLLPRGGSSAVDIGKGIEDVLKLFPVVTSATRHDEEQLVTFTLQSSDGTDGRIVHLDMRNSGMGKNGWQGRWFVDRVAAFEAEQAPAVVEEFSVTIPAIVTAGTFSFDAPRGRRVGDRIIVVMSTGGLSSSLTAPAGWSLIQNVATTTSVDRIYELLINTQALTGVTGDTITVAGGAPIAAQIGSCVVLRVFLVRGAHASAPSEVGSGTSATTATPTSPTLTPTWGNAFNLWISACTSEAAPALGNIVPTLLQGNSLTVHRAQPTSYEHTELVASTSGTLVVGTTGDFTQALGTAWRQLRTTSQGPLTWTLSNANVSRHSLIAVRPLAGSGTPIRASVQFNGRLVVCNSTDVLESDPDAISDQGGVQIEPYIELADIYPMGIGGAGRHLGVTFVGQLLGICALTPLYSYDNGRNWTAGRTYRLSPANGWQIGQTVRVQWTPKRRKIEGVRVRFVVSREDGIAVPAGPLTQGLAFNQAVLWFEDLAGPSRNDYKRTQ